MKKLLFGLVATVMISLSGFANVSPLKSFETSINKELPQEVQIQYSYGNKKVSTNKTFTSQGLEMQTYIDSELDKMESVLNSLSNAKELTCSATVHVGTANNYIEVTVSGPCSEIAAQVKKLKRELMASL
ncbi:hypothetical protein [Flavobacterium sp. FPG59]|jgi:hypothetical protein|uniref:hypothetical protein n=1 Tax=Flavobacterium sp. FPG59 TaxID=1929267 RepID=UPI000A39F29C|nr:hypothetical protein [Flavobacterium sp. FPG59]OUD29812.1 hypothetical protein FPG59_15540 [Flavobacterium sp. FPG59]